jgi:hypothetical protein
MKFKRTLILFSSFMFFFFFLTSAYAGSIQLSWQANSEPDLKGYNLYMGKAPRAYNLPLALGKVNEFTMGNLENDTVYYLALTAVDNAGNESGFSSEIEIKTDSGTSAPPVDVTPPAVTISAPTAKESFDTDQAKIAVAGNASDANGIARISWQTDRGTSGQAEGLTTWSVSSIALSEGRNTISIHAFDTAGNEAVDQLVVVYTPPDVTAPTIGITAPVEDDVYTTAIDQVMIAGQASDDRGLARVEWSSSNGDKGVAAGTESWSIADMVLQPGENKITLVAVDLSGNQSTDAISVYYEPVQDLVSAVKPASGRSYKVVESLADGNQAYVDRQYTYHDVPQALLGSNHIVTANDDKASTGNDFLSFQVSQPTTVYVAHDDRITTKPDWLKGFYDTGLKLTTDVAMTVYARVCEAGTVTLGGNGGSRDASMYTIVVSETVSTPTVSLPLEISNLSAASGKTYRLQENLADGRASYIDRKYAYESVPESLAGLAFIMTANDDKTFGGESHLHFQINKRATVYVAHDDRISTKPNWMKGFGDTGLKLNTDVPMSVYARVYDAGTVTLGGNGGSTDTSMYSVIVSE